ncbi:hypothetical protein SAMN04488695_101295 [Proteiniclasticum ruminis]|uniref:Uncharacterized protein n=1 Tax=Proteiniclasticum ruminis TaxID=398199 RepID=A0A1I4XZJ9_9CLOT|nr:hypothetical protein SAMN04488695_101295 [Proteiniclasticum ruminis]
MVLLGEFPPVFHYMKTVENAGFLSVLVGNKNHVCPISHSIN